MYGNVAVYKYYFIMNRIKKGKPCSLEAWWGAGRPILSETGLYFNNRAEVEAYLNSKLPEYRGKLVEYYIYQSGELTDIHLGLYVK